MYNGDLFFNCSPFQLVILVCDINMKSCTNTVSLTVTRRVSLVEPEGLLNLPEGLLNLPEGLLSLPEGLLNLPEHLRLTLRFQWGSFYSIFSFLYSV